MTLEQKAFGFIKVTERSEKPRETGLTVVADRGLGFHAMEDLLEGYADYLDWAKIGIGIARLLSPEYLKKKITFYQKYDVGCFIAGDFSEAAILQGKIDKFYETVKEIGANGVEIATAQIILPVKEKITLIDRVQKADLKVIYEVGKKGNESWTDQQELVVKEIEAALEKGAWKVLVQGEGIVEDVPEIKGDVIFSIASKVPPDRLIFQAKDARSQAWFLSHFGHSVNLDVDSHQVVDLELSRRGIRKRGLFGLLSSVGSD